MFVSRNSYIVARDGGFAFPSFPSYLCARSAGPGRHVPRPRTCVYVSHGFPVRAGRVPFTVSHVLVKSHARRVLFYATRRRCIINLVFSKNRSAAANLLRIVTEQRQSGTAETKRNTTDNLGWPPVTSRTPKSQLITYYHFDRLAWLEIFFYQFSTFNLTERIFLFLSDCTRN